MFISQTQMAKLALLICLFGIQTGAASKKHFKYAIGKWNIEIGVSGILH